MQIDQLEKYKCRVKLRPNFNGRPLKDGVKVLEGKEIVLEAMWHQCEDDNYPGEWAMGDSFKFNSSDRLFDLTGGAIAWISSGDLEILERIDT